jgi:hypothetical protein
MVNDVFFAVSGWIIFPYQNLDKKASLVIFLYRDSA